MGARGAGKDLERTSRRGAEIVSILLVHLIRDLAPVLQLTDALLVMDHGSDLSKQSLLLRLLGLDGTPLVRAEVCNHLYHARLMSWNKS